MAPEAVTYVASQKTLTVNTGQTRSFTLSPSTQREPLGEVTMTHSEVLKAEAEVLETGVIKVNVIGVSEGTSTVVVFDGTKELGKVQVRVK